MHLASTHHGLRKYEVALSIDSSLPVSGSLGIASVTVTFNHGLGLTAEVRHQTVFSWELGSHGLVEREGESEHPVDGYFDVAPTFGVVQRIDRE